MDFCFGGSHQISFKTIIPVGVEAELRSGTPAIYLLVCVCVCVDPEEQGSFKHPFG